MSFVKSLPAIPVLVRKEFLYNFEKGFGEFESGWWVSVKSIRGRALLFETLLSNGALYDKLPISAFCWKESNPMNLSILQLWDNLSSEISIIEKSFLTGMPVEVYLKNKTIEKGTYLFTIDYSGWGTLAETAQEHKSANVIKLDNGNFAIQPNNRMLFCDNSLTAPSKPDYIASQIIWSCEEPKTFCVSEDNSFFYETKD